MGSSPVTATISPLHTHSTPAASVPPAAGSPVAALVSTVERELARLGPAAPGDRLLVAFSGGADSLALLLALSRLAPAHGWRLVAGHVDHGLDPGSAARAAAARELAASLGVDCDVAAAASPSATRGSGREAAAREMRYRLLEELLRRHDARWLLTAHHADDQAETVLLRLLHGSGIAGLAGIPGRRERVLRPLLGCRRGLLAAAVAEAALRALTDPTNHDLAVPRNRLRHGLLAARPELVAGAGGLAAAAAGARARVESTVARLAPAVAGPAGAHLQVAALLSLPAELRPWALAGLARAAGLPYPPRRAAVAELLGQLARGSAAGCDAAAGWRWERRGERLELAPTGAAPAPAGPPGQDRGTTVRAGAEPGVARGRSAGPAPAPRRAVATPAFAYTLAVPGGVEIREAATIFRLTRQPVAPWMRRGSATRAALDLPLAAGDLVTVRSRRPGDRLRPLGGPGERRLKDVLIDRKVPRQQRDGLPLLCVGGRVAWVPGVTVDDAFRLAPDAREAWVAELLPADAGAEDAR